MHKRFVNHCTLDLTIIPDGPILIKSGREGADPTKPQMEFVETYHAGGRTIYLPGSSLKGAIRAHAERIVRTVGHPEYEKPSDRKLIWANNPLDTDKYDYLYENAQAEQGVKKKLPAPKIYKESSFTDQIFGNIAIASRLRIEDAYPDISVPLKIEERNGVAIDRVFGSVAHGPFDYQVCTSGAFQTKIKTMVQGNDNELLIQGSSLKGCIRSVYEAITNSRVGVKPKQPNEYPKERLPASDKNKLCPASIVFGASGEKWGWQGLITIQDAHCEITGFEVGFMPNLWRPRPDENQAYYDNKKTVGWKFYYNMKNSIDKGLDNGIPVQVAFRNDEFSTQLNFRNLKPEELGALLIVLGQDKNYPLVLKVGAGKPVGMGTMSVDITADEIIQNKADLHNRYTSLVLPSNQLLTDESLNLFIQNKIQQAHEALIEQSQLKKLSEILSPVTNRIPHESY